MKLLYLLISGFFLTAWIALGSTGNPLGTPLPQTGQFFHPAKGFWVNASSPSLERDGVARVQLNETEAKGTIFFDRLGIPHIFADDLPGAFFLEGYVHAADRLWQMDVSTRATEGRLSEILGRRTYERDRKQIRHGYRQSAEQELAVIQADFPLDYQYIKAYSDGVNGYLDQLSPADYPVEYKLLGHEPLRWSPYRCILLLKGMSQSLSSRNHDMARRTTQELLSPELYKTLFPDYAAGDSPVVPSPYGVNRANKKLLPFNPHNEALTQVSPPPNLAPARMRPDNERDSGAAPQPTEAGIAILSDLNRYPQAFTLMPEHDGNGSNNWAVNADHSITGYPMLANDPHLSLTLPSIWHEVQIHTPKVNARGVSLPGAPGIMIGYNDNTAFGSTNVGQDVTDWFKITWADSSRSAYLLDGETVPTHFELDTLHIKGEPAEVIKTPWTHFGPVPFNDGPAADHAMRYLGHQKIDGNLREHTSIVAFVGLMTAENYLDYEVAIQGHSDPAQNFIYADRFDQIAIRPNGFFPVRSSGDGGLPFAGDTRANDWRGYIPFKDRPVHRNPERGFVASANQVTTGPDYPYVYNGKFSEYRGRYINRELKRENVLNQRTMKELQLSSYSLEAEELEPILLSKVNRQQLTKEGMELFRMIADWDYQYSGDSKAASLFELWKNKVYQLTFDELDKEELDPLYPTVRVFTKLLKQRPEHVIFDIETTDNFRETAATIVQRAFEEVLENLDGQDPVEWAIMRDSRVRHLGAIPGLGSGLITSGGGRKTPRALSGGHGASWRMVVELGKHPRAWGALPGGASGHPGSVAYDNALEDWANGRYHELERWRDWEEAENKSVGRWEFE